MLLQQPGPSAFSTAARVDHQSGEKDGEQLGPRTHPLLHLQCFRFPTKNHAVSETEDDAFWINSNNLKSVETSLEDKANARLKTATLSAPSVSPQSESTWSNTSARCAGPR